MAPDVPRETPDRPEPIASWEVRSAAGVLLCWGKEPAHALALAFDLGGTVAPSAGPLT